MQMRYIASYLLLVIAGVASPDEAAIRKVLDAAGVETDEDQLSKLLTELKGKDINEVRSL
jgi:large subunit ribosomal protein LP2